MKSSGHETPDSVLLHAKVNSIPAYNARVRVLFYENQEVEHQPSSLAQEEPVQKKKGMQVRFVCRHKALAGMEAILILALENNHLENRASQVAQPYQFTTKIPAKDGLSENIFETKGFTATVKSIYLRDADNDLEAASEGVINAMILALLRAAFEYGEKRQVDEWKLTVAPLFTRQLSRFGIQQQHYGTDTNGRITIGVNPCQFIHAGKQVIELWNHHLFEATPELHY